MKRLLSITMLCLYAMPVVGAQRQVPRPRAQAPVPGQDQPKAGTPAQPAARPAPRTPRDRVIFDPKDKVAQAATPPKTPAQPTHRQVPKSGMREWPTLSCTRLQEDQKSKKNRMISELRKEKPHDKESQAATPPKAPATQRASTARPALDRKPNPPQPRSQTATPAQPTRREATAPRAESAQAGTPVKAAQTDTQPPNAERDTQKHEQARAISKTKSPKDAVEKQEPNDEPTNTALTPKESLPIKPIHNRLLQEQRARWVEYHTKLWPNMDDVQAVAFIANLEWARDHYILWQQKLADKLNTVNKQTSRKISQLLAKIKLEAKSINNIIRESHSSPININKLLQAVDIIIKQVNALNDECSLILKSIDHAEDNEDNPLAASMECGVELKDTLIHWHGLLIKHQQRNLNQAKHDKDGPVRTMQSGTPVKATQAATPPKAPATRRTSTARPALNRKPNPPQPRSRPETAQPARRQPPAPRAGITQAGTPVKAALQPDKAAQPTQQQTEQIQEIARQMPHAKAPQAASPAHPAKQDVHISQLVQDTQGEIPLPASLAKLQNIRIIHLRANLQSGLQCGSRSFVNALAIQQLIDQRIPITGERICLQAKMLGQFVTYDEFDQVRVLDNARDQHLHNLQIVDFDEQKQCPMHLGSMPKSDKPLAELLPEIAEKNVTHFIFCTGKIDKSGHYTLATFIKNPKSVPTIIFMDSLNHNSIPEKSITTSLIQWLHRDLIEAHPDKMAQVEDDAGPPAAQAIPVIPPHYYSIPLTQASEEITSCAQLLDNLNEFNHAAQNQLVPFLQRISFKEYVKRGEFDSLLATLGYNCEHITNLQRSLRVNGLTLGELLAEGQRIRERLNALARISHSTYEIFYKKTRDSQHPVVAFGNTCLLKIQDIDRKIKQWEARGIEGADVQPPEAAGPPKDEGEAQVKGAGSPELAQDAQQDHCAAGAEAGPPAEAAEAGPPNPPYYKIVLEQASEEVASCTELLKELRCFNGIAQKALTTFGDAAGANSPLRGPVNTLCHELADDLGRIDRLENGLQTRRYTIHALINEGQRMSTEMAAHIRLAEQTREANGIDIKDLQHAIVAFKNAGYSKMKDIDYEIKRWEALGFVRQLILENPPPVGQDRLRSKDFAMFLKVAKRLPQDQVTMSCNAQPLSWKLTDSVDVGESNLKAFFIGAMGSGKTQLAQAVAQVVERPCFVIEIPNLLTEYRCSVSSGISEAFDPISSKFNMPCVVVLDEIDSKVEGVTNSDLSSGKTTSLMLDAGKTNKVLIIGTANHRKEISETILNRVKTICEFSAPNQDQKKSALRKYIDVIHEAYPTVTVDPSCTPDDYIAHLATRDTGKSYRELQWLIGHAVDNAKERVDVAARGNAHAVGQPCALLQANLNREDFERALREKKYLTEPPKTLTKRAKEIFKHMASAYPYAMEGLRQYRERQDRSERAEDRRERAEERRERAEEKQERLKERLEAEEISDRRTIATAVTGLVGITCGPAAGAATGLAFAAKEKLDEFDKRIEKKKALQIKIAAGTAGATILVAKNKDKVAEIAKKACVSTGQAVSKTASKSVSFVKKHPYGTVGAVVAAGGAAYYYRDSISGFFRGCANTWPFSFYRNLYRTHQHLSNRPAYITAEYLQKPKD